jgi:membrane-associated PAP2 superfamily phosphatase
VQRKEAGDRPGLGSRVPGRRALPMPARDGLVTVLALMMLLAWDASGADGAVMNWTGSAHGFAWRDHWFTAGVLHTGGRGAGLMVVLVLALNVWRPLLLPYSLRRMDRWLRLWWLAVPLVCILAISLMKRASLTSCPWDMAEFGGMAHQVSHWWIGRPDGGPGHCFPSGHASSAFSLFAGWFVLRGHAHRLAHAWLCGVLVSGMVLGAVQVLRGAHPPSHILWTAWICWTTTTFLWQAARCAACCQPPSLSSRFKAQSLPTSSWMWRIRLSTTLSGTQPSKRACRTSSAWNGPPSV